MNPFMIIYVPLAIIWGASVLFALQDIIAALYKINNNIAQANEILKKKII